ncbi:MAG: KR domain-containing protein, partial [Elusimicrobiota bacterium]
PESVRAAVDRVRRELGPIRAVVHGAGVLADKSIEDKEPGLFGPVFDTKVAGLRHILAAIGFGELKVLALFSSVSGRFGRAGQADYAMANEALNKAAQSLARRRPDCRVVSINWGPWEGGRVTPSLRRIFEGEGVALLPLREGGEHLVAELAGAGVETVVQAKSAPVREDRLETVFERELDLRSHPFLTSHVINGLAVLPVAMMIEWLAHAALHGNPGLVFCGLDGLRVTRGVILKDGAKAVRVRAGRAEREGESWRVRVELHSPEGLCAKADVVLRARAIAAEPARALAEGAAYGRSVSDAYRDLLFHGPMLRGIEAVESCSGEGIAVKLAAAPVPSSWMQKPVRGAWLAEPLAIDAAFQAVILWSFEQNGAACLPNSMRRYRQFRSQFPKQGL